MAGPSSSPLATYNPLFGQVISEKLTKANYALWKAQALTIVRGVRLEGFLTGASKAPAKEVASEKDAVVANPAYEEWVATDQQVLGFLLTNLSRDVLVNVSSCKMAAEAWLVIETSFSSMTKARSVNTRIALATTRKGDLSIAAYASKMRALGDELSNAGKTIDDDELISYILAGLDEDYNPVVTSLVGRVEPLTYTEAYSQLLSFEHRLELIRGAEAQHVVNWAGRGCGGQRGRAPRPRGPAGLAVQTVAMEAAVVVGVLLARLRTTTTPIEEEALTTGLGARCARREAIWPQTAGIGMMKIMCQMNAMQEQLCLPMESTPTGTRILVLLIMSRGNSRS